MSHFFLDDLSFLIIWELITNLKHLSSISSSRDNFSILHVVKLLNNLSPVDWQFLTNGNKDINVKESTQVFILSPPALKIKEHLSHNFYARSISLFNLS